MGWGSLREKKASRCAAEIPKDPNDTSDPQVLESKPALPPATRSSTYRINLFGEAAPDRRRQLPMVGVLTYLAHLGG